MALPLSLKRQQDKKKKFEKKLVNFLKDFRADDLKKSLDNAFIGGKSPNASEFVKLVSSARHCQTNLTSHWLISNFYE